MTKLIKCKVKPRCKHHHFDNEGNRVTSTEGMVIEVTKLQASRFSNNLIPLATLQLEHELGAAEDDKVVIDESKGSEEGSEEEEEETSSDED